MKLQLKSNSSLVDQTQEPVSWAGIQSQTHTQEYDNRQYVESECRDHVSRGAENKFEVQGELLEVEIQCKHAITRE